jgi:DNA-binding MarR family transcriptional regulator
MASCDMRATALTKHSLLTYLADTSEADANDVANAFGVDYPVAAMALLRLVRQGLANRRRASERGVYRYRLSERGQSRLEYLGSRRSASG